MLLMNAMTYWPPAVLTSQQIAVFNELVYFSMAGVAAWLGMKRISKAANTETGPARLISTESLP